ncbi:MAG TPA: hypothetical protein VFS23_04005, partial [Vicinamibacterales bacterium]|nr:hypothetical protein [Vicinamibacterales bacterium]
GPVTETVTIGVVDPVVRLREAQTARVTVSIGAAPEEWFVHGVAVQVKSGRGAFTVSPADVTIRVRGPRDSVDTNPDHYSAAVDVTGLAAGKHLRLVRVEPPAGIGLVGVEPAEVVVTIR